METNHYDNRKIEESMVLDEAAALIRYVSERGMDPEADITGPLKIAIEQCRAIPSEGSPDQTPEEISKAKIELNAKIFKLYSKLTSLTYNESSGTPINGRTLLDTEYVYKGKCKLIMFWAFIFFIVAMKIESLDLYFKEAEVAANGSLLLLKQIHLYALDGLSPFLWGAIGACVFLLKTLSDKAGDRCFDSRKWHGWGTRIILGALLGATVTILYDPEFFQNDEINQTANAIAFLSGVGVKVIYGAIEKLINVMSEKFNLGSQEHISSANENIRTFLMQQLALTGEEDVQRKEWFKSLLAEVPE